MGPLPNNGVLDIRIYTIQPGRRQEFDILVQTETVPLAERYGHRIVAVGPSSHDTDTYYLIRVFGSLEERETALNDLYGGSEWREGYDTRVMEYIVSYETAVVEISDLTDLSVSVAAR